MGASPPPSDTESLVKRRSDGSDDSTVSCNRDSFFGFLILLVIILLFYFFYHIIVSFISFFVCASSRSPKFQVSNFSVSNFTVSDHLNLNATWDANITVTNPSRSVTLHVDKVQAFVYYKNKNNFLSHTVTLKEKLRIRPQKVGVVNVVTSSIPLENDLAMEIRSWLLEYKTMSFRLRVTVYGSVYYLGKGFDRGAELACDRLKVDFKNGYGSSLDLPIECDPTTYYPTW